MMIDCDREKWPNFTETWEMGKDRLVALLTLKENAVFFSFAEYNGVFNSHRAILIAILFYYYWI